MNLIAHFNYRLAIAERKGYSRCVAFEIDPSLAGVPPSTQVAAGAARSPREERSGHQLKYHPQLHRTNRVGRYQTAEARRLKQESNERYRERRKALRMARAQLILWPTKES